MNTVRKDRSSTHNGEEENEGDRDQAIKAQFLIGSHVFLWNNKRDAPCVAYLDNHEPVIFAKKYNKTRQKRVLFLEHFLLTQRGTEGVPCSEHA
jgi:hypothetical protein|tara:strand:- start:535807 stop:536088 length:282 start_codon:yes stop_codon:yes gene_type:complete